MTNINVNITINTQENTQGSGKTEKENKAERRPIDRTGEVLIDNSTTFNGLLDILSHIPEAVEAEKAEIEEKEREAKEAEKRRIYGEDYELICGEAGKSSEGVLTKAKRRPGAVQLRKYEPRIAMITTSSGTTCEVFSNGYAVYDNGDRKTVLWVPDCGSATYYFTQLRDNEKTYLKQKDEVGEDVFGPSPWYFALTVAGEDSIERNLIHPKSKGNASDKDDPADWEGLPDWRCVGGTHFDTPEEYVLKKEAAEERRRALTKKQRDAYDLYYGEGYSQREIADMYGVEKTTIRDRLEAARNIYEKNPEKFFS